MSSEGEQAGSIGATLRSERERRGIDLDEIERETRIRRRQLQALEDDRFEWLPGTAYARAFLRTYADYLDLDAEQLIDRFNALQRDQDGTFTAVRRAPRMSGRQVFGQRRALRRSRRGVLLALALLLVALLVFAAHATGTI